MTLNLARIVRLNNSEFNFVHYAQNKKNYIYNT